MGVMIIGESLGNAPGSNRITHILLLGGIVLLETPNRSYRSVWWLQNHLTVMPTIEVPTVVVVPFGKSSEVRTIMLYLNLF